jgi:hypothetical protein
LDAHCHIEGCFRLVQPFRVSALVGEPRSGIPLAGYCQQVVRNIDAQNPPVLANGLGHLVAEESRTAADIYDALARTQCEALKGGITLRHHVGARVNPLECAGSLAAELQDGRG